jgi:N-acetylglucosaminyldiphosphoundecaprenol N-acetyl-beta-D-mannosaminyltransferase
MDDTVALLTEWAESGQPHHVVTVNPIMIMDALAKPHHRETLRDADMLVPDGAGVVWAAGYVKQPVAERVPGIELMHRLLAVADARGWRVYLLGTTAETIRAAAERLRAAFPGAVFEYRDGYFGPEQDDAVADAVRAFAPHLLFVARSADLQDPWIRRYRERLGVPVMMGVGGSFDVVAGKLKRAPHMFRKLRLEWLYRLIQEPSRWRRMLALPKFMVKVIRDGKKATSL